MPNTSRQFHDLFDPELVALPDVAALLPSFRFLLDDLSQVSDAALQARARQDAELLVPLVLWAFRDGRSKERFLRSVVEWIPLLHALWQSNDDPSVLDGLWSYIWWSRPTFRSMISLTSPQRFHNPKVRPWQHSLNS